MDLLEYYHSTGKCPDWAYYQLNKKSIQENYREIKSRQDALQRERRQDAKLDKAAQDQLELTVAAALEEVLKALSNSTPAGGMMIR